MKIGNFFLILIFAVGFSACTKDEIETPSIPPATDQNGIEASSENTQLALTFLLNPNGLHIQKKIEDREDKTRYFRDYKFFFNADGTVFAISASDRVEGTYRVFRDDGRIELAMVFPNLGEFNELRDDWYLVLKNEEVIRWEDGGDVLQFGGTPSNVSDPGAPNPNPSDIDAVRNFLMVETGLFIQEKIEDRENKTRYFRDYKFFFNADGTVFAISASDKVEGTYRVFRDDGRIELAMVFPNVGEFNELRDDWYFITIENSAIKFGDSSDSLIFEKP